MELLDKLQTFVNSYLIPWITSRPESTWYALGAFLGSTGIVIGIVAWKRWKFLKDNGEKLGTKLTLLNVQIWSLVVSGTGWLIDAVANGSQLFGSFVPKEYVAHATEMAALAVAVHAVATKLLAWWTDRKKKKPLILTTPAETVPETPVQPSQPSSDLLS